MAYAIARIKKLKRSNLAGSEAHTARQRETLAPILSHFSRSCCRRLV
ncbi:hypothetical protein H6G97_38630 [Nostoc flagelliforme FACHB-838]|uniref:Transposase n=1 Tax=Nostoc flagelliforme FACHB-838 TaxID=2692904 RepID=A0ABR8E1B0_9NOSO|nr:hypothetical protein [Nostoc flagelliforme FACHB-838]